ncbi:hypothetical protein EF888_01675 [Silicimonas algicola]|nr:hypothetical protein EF888_01675 [Silicimonas algicola]
MTGTLWHWFRRPTTFGFSAAGPSPPNCAAIRDVALQSSLRWAGHRTKILADEARNFRNLRAYCSFMWTQPGNKLLFMGQEFARTRELRWRSG